MDLTSKISAIVAAFALTISSATANLALAQPKEAIVSGCDGVKCVVGRFDGVKWQISDKPDDRAGEKLPTINYENFKPSQIDICTGLKCLTGVIQADGTVKVVVTTDDRTYKAPSVSVVAP